MPKKDKEKLYELYIASLEIEIPDQLFSDLKDLNIPDKSELSFADIPDFAPEDVGIILATISEEFLIESLIVGKNECGLYEAYKVSSFTCFASEYDIIFQAGHYSYILEMDNHYYLEENEVKEGIVFDYLEPKELADLKEKILEHKDKTLIPQTGTDLNSPENKFRIMEHKLTLSYRKSSAALWIPQIQLQFLRDEESVLAHTAADSGLDEIFRIFEKQKDQNSYFAREFSLHRNENKELMFITDLEYIGQKAEILCGDIVVFRGVLPEQLILVHFMPLTVDKAQNILGVSVKIVKD
jgi:hypothetical protein